MKKTIKISVMRSRAQAKRIAVLLRECKTVVFDFDEAFITTERKESLKNVFLWFVAFNPDIEILTINADPEVQKLIEGIKKL